MKIVVFGSDRYLKIMWPTFWRFFRQYWPDCPYPVQAVSQGYPVPNTLTLCTGPDETFSQQVLRFVSLEGDEPFLMLLDDYFLNVRVNTDVVQAAYRLMVNDPHIQHINLKVIGGDVWKWRVDDNFGEFDKAECNWLFQNQAGIWRPKLLRDVTRPEEDGWRMETQGSKRARDYPGRFLTVYEDAINYVNYMGRGGPRQEGLDWLKQNGADLIYP